MEKQATKSSYTTVTIPEFNTTAVLFANQTEQLAIVDLATIQRLAELLPPATFGEIKYQFIENIKETETLAQYTDVIVKELAFHQSVNMIRMYKPEPEQEEALIARTPFEKIDLD